MKTGNVKKIILDVDGCVLSTKGKVSHSYYMGLSQLSEMIAKANQFKFPPICFCSGRDRNYIEAVAFATGLPNCWSIIESGVALFNPTTKEMKMNPELTEEIQRTFREITQKRIPHALGRYNGEIFLYPGNMICIAIERAYRSKLTIEDCYDQIRMELLDLLEEGLIKVTHSDSAVDISPAGIDKASGLSFLMEREKVNPDEILGIGDSRGDFPVLKKVRHVGCPSNASPECKNLVKEKGGYISPFSEARGIADIISRFVKGA